MTLGEKLRDIRAQRGLTQPELAERSGVEQSYISKLENNLSIPSSDKLHQILNALDTSVEDIVADIEEFAEDSLTHVSEISTSLRDHKRNLARTARRIVIQVSFTIALGAGLILAGATSTLYDTTYYQYRSLGIVLVGESKEIFENPADTIPSTASDREIQALKDQITERISQDYLTVQEYRGRVFNIPVEGGSRTYFLRDKTTVSRWQNQAAMWIGVTLFVFGIFLILNKQTMTGRRET
tara:strand:- start:1639 stop:2358 length:720 start_codon:yes stop_codon:yes gene_type:complete